MARMFECKAKASSIELGKRRTIAHTVLVEIDADQDATFDQMKAEIKSRFFKAVAGVYGKGNAYLMESDISVTEKTK